jgi:S-ribosylhomocysteine lyase LuxS involved in autoinducer biosynthesis
MHACTLAALFIRRATELSRRTVISQPFGGKVGMHLSLQTER